MGCGKSKPGVDVAKKPVNFHESYQLGGKVGKGAFAQVRVAKKIDIGTNCAVKILDMRSRAEKDGVKDSIDAQVRRDAQNEAAVWRRVGVHEHCVQLLDAFMDKWLCYFVMELCDYSFVYALERTPQLTESTLAKFFKDMLESLRHIHEAGVVHRDIKPDNFLCTGDACMVKLCDFGLAEVMPKNGSLSGVYGTAPFMSPEMLNTKAYDERTDDWSLGVLAYVLLYGQFPYKAQDKSSRGMKQAIKVGTPPPSYKPWKSMGDNQRPSSKAESFCRDLIERDPKLRKASTDMLSSEFIVDIGPSDAQPSLRPMFVGALKAGAFGTRVQAGEHNDVDVLLNDLQVKYHGPIKPWTPPRPQSSLLKELQKKDGEDKTSKRRRHDDEERKNNGENGQWETASTGTSGGASSTASIPTWSTGGQTMSAAPMGSAPQAAIPTVHT
mmetsp:Transcript_16428/g.37877  ORF Transcript_16428/g.37877 Transcript_16428/m.37877 type:complete len:439 (-) Transcript_16428:163-1479(-)